MAHLSRSPCLVASTSDVYCCSIRESKLRERELPRISQTEEGPARAGYGEDLEVNYFKSAQWSPDGTSLLTSSADNAIRTFILPPTLLNDPSSPISLTPYTTHHHPTSINCLAPYPLFDLSDPTTTLYLSASNDIPIRLINTLSPTPAPVSTYQLISPTTEAYQTPSSIIWASPSTFLTGTDCLVSLFDVSRNGEGPLSRMPTIPSKRHKIKGGGVGMRGVVSALSLQPSETTEVGMLAAGTWTRWVGLYDMAGMGGTVATWSIAEAADVYAGVGGAGVTQTSWSSCGKYLFVAERKSRGVLVYDVRLTSKLVAWLVGREAITNQRLGVDIFQAESGTEIWAGGEDGIVKIWEGVGMSEGALEKSWEWAAHKDAVGSTVVHSSGTVVATCSGQRSLSPHDQMNCDESDISDEGSSGDEDQSSETSDAPLLVRDNSIKVWSL